MSRLVKDHTEDDKKQKKQETKHAVPTVNIYERLALKPATPLSLNLSQR